MVSIITAPTATLGKQVNDDDEQGIGDQKKIVIEAIRLTLTAISFCFLPFGSVGM